MEYKETAGKEDEGLTIPELEQVAADVGIDPAYISRALQYMDATEFSQEGSGLWGGPFAFRVKNRAERIIQEEEWEEIVAEIRRINGGIGQTGKLGRTYEWEQRKTDVGYIQVSLRPERDHTEININASYRYYTTAVYMLACTAGFMLGMLLIPSLDLLQLGKTVSGIGGSVMGLIGARFYLSYWNRKKKRMIERMLDRFKKLLESKDKPRESLLNLPEDELSIDSKQETPAVQKRARS